MAGEPTREVPASGGGEPASTPPRSHRKRRIVIVVALVVLAAGAGIGTWLGTSGSTGPGFAVTTEVVTVSTGTMKQTVSASGTVQPASEADLSFAVSGKVTAVGVSVGDVVTAGQVMATVDPAALQATASSAQASLTAAQAKLSSDESAGASTSQLLSDRAAVSAAQSQLTSANANVADASLTSPIAGTVASVDLTAGQQVSGTGTSGSGSSGTGSSSGFGGSSSTATSSSSAQVVVVSTDSFKVSTTVDDTQIGQVKQGDQVTINPSSSNGASGAGGAGSFFSRFSANAGGSASSNSSNSSANSNSSSRSHASSSSRTNGSNTGGSGSSSTYYGTVSSVGLLASSSTGVASFPVTVDVTGTPSGLYAGASATLTIVVKELRTVVEVPTGAISYSGGTAEVTVVTGGKHVTRAVTTGQVSTGETQITSGLEVGDKVVYQVLAFRGSSSTGRSLLGGSGRTTSGGFPGGAGFPGGGGGGFPRGAGFPGGGGGGFGG